MSFHSFFSSVRRSFESRPFLAILIVLVSLLLALAIFEAGVLVGLHEARGAYRWGEAYQRNFGGPVGGFVSGVPVVPGGHGTFGRIASTSGSTFIISDPMHPEETVKVASTTVIRDADQSVPPSALGAGSYVVVIGGPNADGVIDATLVRIMPAPPHEAGTSAAPN